MYMFLRARPELMLQKFGLQGPESVICAIIIHIFLSEF